MKVYIAGPMTGIEDFNFPAFHAAAAHLRANGYEVVNPAEVNPDTTLTWEQCMRLDIPQLCTCDAIALLPGWENSRGARLECHLAEALGMPQVRFGHAVTGEVRDRAEIDRLRDALGAIRQYGVDTLTGRVDGPDDRAWQRAAVNEMAKRARLALEGKSWADGVSVPDHQTN